MKTQINFILTTLFALIFINVSQAQESIETFSLKEALNYALTNSIEIQKSILDQEQADYAVAEIRSQALPQITGSGDLNYFPNIPTQLLPGEIIGQPGIQVPIQFGTEYTLSGGFDLSQKIFDQSLMTGLKAVKTSEELYTLLKIQTDEDVIYQVSATYYQLLELQAQINSLDSNIVKMRELENIMRDQFDNEMVTKIDYSRIKVNRTNMETTLQSLQTTEEQQKNLLKVLMGMPVEIDIALINNGEMDETSLRSLQFDKNKPIEIQLIEKELELNVLNQKNIKAGYYPSLSAFANQSWQAQRNEFNFLSSNAPWFQQTIVGLRLSVPIFDGFYKKSKVQQSMIAIKKLELDQINADRNLDVRYLNAREALVNTIKSVQAQKENEILAQEVYDQSQDLYKEQVGTLTDLLDAENALRNAQVNYRRELLKFRKAELDVLQAQGQLKQLVQQ